MKINDLNPIQKDQFCLACAVVIASEETDIAYSNATDFVGVSLPEDFNFTDGESGEMYQKAYDVMTDTYYVRLLFDTTYFPNDFEASYEWNKGFVFAMEQLHDAEPMESNDDFQEFCDTITDA